MNNKLNNNELIQIGGFVGSVITGSKFVLEVGKDSIKGLALAFVNLFKVTPEDWDSDAWNILKWFPGPFWIFIGLCIKSSLYLVIFAFGGPIVSLIGIAFLYYNVYTKHILQSEDDEEDKNKEGEGEAAEGKNDSSGA